MSLIKYAIARRSTYTEGDVFEHVLLGLRMTVIESVDFDTSVSSSERKVECICYNEVKEVFERKTVHADAIKRIDFNHEALFRLDQYQENFSNDSQYDCVGLKVYFRCKPEIYVFLLSCSSEGLKLLCWDNKNKEEYILKVGKKCVYAVGS